MSGGTVQEAAWAGPFGDAYVERNRDPSTLPARTALLARILARTGGVASVLELGANVGLNLRALRTLLPAARLAAVEINASAHAELAAIAGVEAHHGSLLDPVPPGPFDLVLTAGVLIHVAPERLPDAYDRMVGASARYVALIEYFNPTPVEVPYRGSTGLLFKRDFASELLDRHEALRVVDYGFAWRRDSTFPLDDATWFLLEQRA
jgi:spore coat polysaccharide biosynthesis protein SpsF